MKIQFDFFKYKRSVYTPLLEDYIRRLGEFAKIGAVKGKSLDLCFVFGTNINALSACNSVFVSSEKLSELIQISMRSAIPAVRVSVKNAADLKVFGDAPEVSPITSADRIVLINQEIGEELAQVLAAEQIYRAFMIFHNRKYHK